MADIVALNNIENPSKIYSGQRLVLPGSIDLSAAPVAAAPVARIAVPAGGTEYTVQSGDCVSVIAKKFGTTSKALRSVNKLKSDTIFVGQKLVIPAGASPVVTPAPAPVPDPAPVVAPLPPAIDETPDLGGAPVLEAPLPPAPVVEPAPPLPGGMEQARLHKVRAGQSLLGIASEWNVSIDALRRANPWLNDSEPKEGDELVIPPPEV